MSDITVNGRFLTRAPTGVDRFAAELLRAWLPQVRGTHAIKALDPGKSEVMETHGLDLEPVGVGALTGHAMGSSSSCRVTRGRACCSTSATPGRLRGGASS